MKPDAEAIRLHQQGLVLQQRGQLREAIDAYARAISRDPSLELTRQNLAMAHFQLGEADQAILQYKTLLAEHPGNVKAHFNLGLAYSSIGRYDQAIACFQRVLTLESGHVLALEHLIWIYGQQQRVPEAIHYAELLLALNPENTKVLFQLGHLHRQAGDLARAETYWRTLLAVDPRHLNALLCMAEVARLRGDHKDCLRWSLDVLEVNPRHPSALVMVAGAHVQLLEYERAVEVLERVAAQNPDLAEPRLQLGIIHHTLRRTEAARTALEEALRLDGTRFDIPNELGVVLYGAGELRLALNYFLQANTLAPDNAMVMANIGFCHLQLDNPGMAAVYFRQTLARTIPDPTVALAVQCAMDLVGDLPEPS